MIFSILVLTNHQIILRIIIMEEKMNISDLSNTAQKAVEEGKTTAIIAYLTIVGLIIAFVMNNDKKNPFAAYHIRQSLGIGVTGLALGLIASIPILGWMVSAFGGIFIIILWVMGLISALNGKNKPVPLLGEKYQEWFKGI